MTGTRGSACPVWRCTTPSRTSGHLSATCPPVGVEPESGSSMDSSIGEQRRLSDGSNVQILPMKVIKYQAID